MSERFRSCPGLSGIGRLSRAGLAQRKRFVGKTVVVTSPWHPDDLPSDLGHLRSAAPDDFAFLTSLATEHLSAADAERFLSLVRPAIRLEPGGDTSPVLAVLGGSPHVPAGFEWPVWDGHGPLSFIAALDLDAVHRSGLPVDIELPSSGRLLAFYFDGSFDNFEGIVGTWDKESLAGARLIHLTDDRAKCAPVAAPEGVITYRAKPLTGRTVLTTPSWEQPILRRAFGALDAEYREWLDHPVNADAFTEAIWERHSGQPRHQLGGWAEPAQGPVEFEVAEAALSAPFEHGDEVHTAEALLWTLLLQIDTDDELDMMWGDVGTLYWMTRIGAPPGPDAVSFTWQCG